MLELEASGLQGRVAGITEGASYRRTVAPNDLGFRISPLLDLAFDEPHASHPLPEFFLGLTIGFPNRPTGFTPVMELASLRRHPR